MRILRISAAIRRMATAAKNAQHQPIIAVIGATGTGKSDLAVELATRFNGEIINADAVQMYDGLPVITNKISVHEQRGIIHHLLGSISLDEVPWTVQEFLPRTLSIIDEIRSRNRLPILVGGTHYYAQALLFKDHTIEHDQGDRKETSAVGSHHDILDSPTDLILEELRKVDPVMANRWHPNDRRKIQRSLQIYLDTGRPASETYRERLEVEQTAGAGLRFPTLLLWPYCEREAHKVRLDQRVDRMFERGLLDEVSQLLALWKEKEACGSSVDLTKGIWQAIGYRQFEPYQQAVLTGETSVKDLEKLKQIATEQTQAATRRYANSQLKWIRVKLLNALNRSNAMNNLFILNSTDLNKWQESVVQPAVDLTSRFLQHQDLPNPATISPQIAELLQPRKEDLTHSPESWGIQTCEVCGTTAATPQLWKQHLNSRGHRIRLSKKKAQETKGLVSVEQRVQNAPDQLSIIS